MYLAKYLCTISISIIVFFAYCCSIQAETDNSDMPENNNTQNATQSSNFGNAVCLTISPQLKNKIYSAEKIKFEEDPTETLTLKLHYLREAKSIQQVFSKITMDKEDSANQDGYCATVTLTTYANDTLIFHGKKTIIKHIHRIIAAMDLPRPGIDLEIYGIQVSSSDPEKMSEAMSEVRGEIGRNQQLIRETYSMMQQFARTIEIDPKFKKLLENDLGFEFVLDINRPLTLTDILIFLSASEDPSATAKEMANSMSNKFQQKRFSQYIEALNDYGFCPFESFFRSRGLILESESKDLDESETDEINCQWIVDASLKSKTSVRTPASSLAIRSALADFALEYADFVERPVQFDPDALQQTSDVLNTNLRSVMNIINQDIENMFMETTLDNIRWIVSDFNEVTYAQVGKSSIAGLSGLESRVTGEVESNFDITPPLKLTELLMLAKDKKQEIDEILPGLITSTPSTSPESSGDNQEGENSGQDDSDSASATTTAETPAETTTTTITPAPIPDLKVGSLPLTTILGLASAFETNRSERLKLGISGPNLKITPNVLRNMSSAELDFNLTIGDPLDPSVTIPTNDGKPLVNLSRITKHEVDTTVYVDAIDLFAISTFSIQNSIDGGRGYVPIIGTVWRGIFQDIPGFGSLFSWKKDPQTVFHESILLTNSYITPTVMGLALQYPIGQEQEHKKYNNKKYCVWNYKNSSRSEELQSEDKSKSKYECEFLK